MSAVCESCAVSHKRLSYQHDLEKRSKDRRSTGYSHNTTTVLLYLGKQLRVLELPPENHQTTVRLQWTSIKARCSATSCLLDKALEHQRPKKTGRITQLLGCVFITLKTTWSSSGIENSYSESFALIAEYGCGHQNILRTQHAHRVIASFEAWLWVILRGVKPRKHVPPNPDVAPYPTWHINLS